MSIEPERLLSTQEAAARMAVGPSSVKRWADLGLLACVKTAGGHRRFEPREVDRFMRALSAGTVQGASPTSPPSDEVAAWVELLTTPSTSGTLVEARLLEERARAGSWWRAADTLGAVLREIGERWEQGTLSIVREHIASELMHRALGAVTSWMPIASDAPACLLVTADEDPHTLGLSLMEVCAREAGWASIWVGRQTPSAELLAMATSTEARMLAISASPWSSDELKLARLASQLAAICRAREVSLVLGGTGAWPESVEGATRVRTFRELHALLTGAR